MKPQVKNWKTTVAGALLAGLTALAELQSGADFGDWKAWIIPVGMAVIGFLARDADKSTEESK